jgi:hypothetical protein
VLVTGASPGLGKSSLAEALVVTLRTAGRPARLFREGDITSERDFSAVMNELQSTGEVQLDTLLAAADAFLTSARAGSSDVLVHDALFPYLPSLLAWGYADDDIAAFFVRLATLFDGFDVIELHLVGDVRKGLAGAAEREGGDWLDRHLAKVAQYRPRQQITTNEDVAVYYDAGAARSRTLLAAAPWRTVFIDTDRGREHVLAVARAAIT